MGETLGSTKGWNPFTGELDTALAGIKYATLPKEFVPGSRYQPQMAATSPDGKLIAQINDLAASRSLAEQGLFRQLGRCPRKGERRRSFTL